MYIILNHIEYMTFSFFDSLNIRIKEQYSKNMKIFLSQLVISN